jgi:hypothetical protein
MSRALRKVVTVKAGGVIEIRASELAPGTVAEVIVLTEGDTTAVEANRGQELAALFKETQTLPQARAISEDEIAAEVAAYRAGRA